MSVRTSRGAWVGTRDSHSGELVHEFSGSVTALDGGFRTAFGARLKCHRLDGRPSMRRRRPCEPLGGEGRWNDGRPCSSIATISPSRSAALSRICATDRATVGYCAVASFRLRESSVTRAPSFGGERTVAVPLHFIRPLAAFWQFCGATGPHWPNRFQVHLESVFRRRAVMVFGDQ